MVTVPAGSTLMLRTIDGRSIALFSMTAAVVGQEGILDVLTIPGLDERIEEPVERGMVELPTADGLLYVPALLQRDEGKLLIRSAEPMRPQQRRQAPRYGLAVPLRGAAILGPGEAELEGGGRSVTFHGHTIDVAAGGLQATLVGDRGVRLPQGLRGIYVELDPGEPQAVAVALTVVKFRSDLLRARFSFISLADWARLRERAEAQGT